MQVVPVFQPLGAEHLQIHLLSCLPAPFLMCLPCMLRRVAHPPMYRLTGLQTIPAPAPPSDPRRFTGADLYALCSDAWMVALKRAIVAAEAAQAQQQHQQQQGEDGPSSTNAAGPAGDSAAAAHHHQQQQQQQQANGHGSQEEDEEVQVQQADFLAAVQTVQPSLSVEEVAKYEAIRDEYESQAAKSKRY